MDARDFDAVLDTRVVGGARLSGGDVAESYRLELADGRTVFAKTRTGAAPGFFVTEAAGLSWLSEPGLLPVPEVLAFGDDPFPHLVLEWIDLGGGRPDEAAFGRSLARLHRSGAPSFGRDDRRPTGSRGLPNEPMPSWAEFYAVNRLVPLLALAADSSALSPSGLRDLEVLAGRLGSLGVPDEPPARLHGDLWAGNRVVDRSGVSWLIDPAAHGGHREFDLAMMQLFGGFSAECFAAYHEEAPLAAGVEERVALHQVAPLVVHAIKFGGSYRPAAEAAIARYL